jgi:hypothetical protein
MILDPQNNHSIPKITHYPNNISKNWQNPVGFRKIQGDPEKNVQPNNNSRMRLKLRAIFH